MNKLKLDELTVESFDTTADLEKERGTVFGEQECTCPTACTCPGCPTCGWDSCMTDCHTCQESCYGTCYWTCEQTCPGRSTCRESCDTACW